MPPRDSAPMMGFIYLATRYPKPLRRSWSHPETVKGGTRAMLIEARQTVFFIVARVDGQLKESA